MTRKTPAPITRRSFAAGAAASAAVLAAGVPMRISSAQSAPLKVGVLLPRSGFLAQIGQVNQQGYDVGVQLIKEMGGFPDIQMISGDTESDIPKARAAAEKLINEGVHMLTGAFDSGQSSAIAQVAEQRGIPFVINIAAAPDITEQGYKFVFRNFPNAPKIVIDSFAHQKALFKLSGTTPKKVVVMHVNDTFGTGVAGGIKALFPRMEMSYEIADMISYDPRARDLSVEVAKARGTGADALWTVSRLNDAILLTREMVKQRWEPSGILSSGPGYYDDQYLKTLGKLADYVINFVPWFDPQKPMAKRLVAAFEKAHPTQSCDTNVVFSFEAILCCADAYRRAKSTAPQALADALRTTDITDNAAVGGPIKFNAKGHNEWVSLGALQNRDGKLRVILPETSAEAKAVFPVPGWQARG